jgi:NAD+ kinase
VGQRTVLVTAHTGKQSALRSARLVAARLTAAGVAVRTLAAELSVPGAEEVPVGPAAATARCCGRPSCPAPPGSR